MGREKSSLDRMAFANLKLIHHLRVVHVFIYAGSRLLLLLLVSNLILCQGHENYPPYCQNHPGKCQIPLQSLFNRATTVANYNFRLAGEVFYKFVSTVLLAYFHKKPW